MDAKTIYKLMKPHLDSLDPKEKRNLSDLIIKVPARRVSCQHRKIISVSKAKEKLKQVCLREMEREQRERLNSV